MTIILPDLGQLFAYALVVASTAWYTRKANIAMRTVALFAAMLLVYSGSLAAKYHLRPEAAVWFLATLGAAAVIAAVSLSSTSK